MHHFSGQTLGPELRTQKHTHTHTQLHIMRIFYNCIGKLFFLLISKMVFSIYEDFYGWQTQSSRFSSICRKKKCFQYNSVFFSRVTIDHPSINIVKARNPLRYIRKFVLFFCMFPFLNKNLYRICSSEYARDTVMGIMRVFICLQ